MSAPPLPDFLTTLLNGSPFVRGQISELCKGTTRDFLNQSILSRLVLPIPPVAEQHRILAQVRRQLSVADVMDAGAALSECRLAQLRQSVLKWAFEGKLMDQDPSDEPATALLERIRAEREAANATKKSKRKPRRKKKEASL